MDKKALRMSERDNVVVALEDCAKSDKLVVNGFETVIQQDVSFGHKVAIIDISENQNIIKYGEIIGYALKPIKAGEWVHVHNMGCHRGKDQ